MTTRMADYGVTGPWVDAVCDSCGKQGRCITANHPDEGGIAFCFLCILRDIRTMEREQAREARESADYIKSEMYRDLGNA